MEQKKEQYTGGDVMRDALQRRPHKILTKPIIQLTRNAERGIRSLLSILTLLSWKGCARLNKT
jgi:DNA replication initiation complex subunit (GINS family)